MTSEIPTFDLHHDEAESNYSIGDRNNEKLTYETPDNNEGGLIAEGLIGDGTSISLAGPEEVDEQTSSTDSAFRHFQAATYTLHTKGDLLDASAHSLQASPQQALQRLQIDCSRLRKNIETTGSTESASNEELLSQVDALQKQLNDVVMLQVKS